jgi:hypothetical protein
MDKLRDLLNEYDTLSAMLGRDYQISTDVLIGVEVPEEEVSSLPLLHAAISGKWTIRSDRVQNVRHEFATLLRNRRGRAPHLVVVTAEPLPSRLISIGRGTGEVDAVYHVLYEELIAGVEESGSDKERRDLKELVEQGRLKPYGSLVPTLAFG